MFFIFICSALLIKVMIYRPPVSNPGLREADAETTLTLRHKRRRSRIGQEKLSGWDAMTPVKEKGQEGLDRESPDS